MLIIKEPGSRTQILAIHAPYPGRLRFAGVPSSLLHALAPLAESLEGCGALEVLGLLDPGDSSPAFYEGLRTFLERGSVRVVLISTSTAAIEETARIVSMVRDTCGAEVLVVVGGPHEDDVEEKTALRMSGVDISIAGDAEFALERLVTSFLDGHERSPAAFARNSRTLLASRPPLAGRYTVSSPWWGTMGGSESFDGGAAPLELLARRPGTSRPVRFSVFEAPETIPLLVSRGCSYGRCTFCAEGNGGPRGVLTAFEHVRELLEQHPRAALYFQDSIFPATRAVRERLLPLLRESRREWGAQVYLGTLTRPWVDALARAGCRYLYTGLESGSPAVLEAVSKAGIGPELALERLGWIRDAGVPVGISLMFGVMEPTGRLVESASTVDDTVRLAERIVQAGVRVRGFYPNVQTVLPGTQLARGLALAGANLDFYRMPRAPQFQNLEDGGVGHNFLTIAQTPDVPSRERQDLAKRIVEASRHMSGLPRSLDSECQEDVPRYGNTTEPRLEAATPPMEPRTSALTSSRGAISTWCPGYGPLPSPVEATCQPKYR